MQQKILIGGIDDATKCPCIGSIFIAGVIADEDTIATWQQLGVKDSKLIAHKKQHKLAKIIKETATEFYITQITPAMIDDKSLNLNDWEMLVVLKIAQQLQKNNSATRVHIDNWETSEQGFYKRLTTLLSKEKSPLLQAKKIRLSKKNLLNMNFIPEHRADENYTVVGAASILAKTASLNQYSRYKKLYGDFGSGSPADPKTRLFMWQHRHNPLPIMRISWNTYKTLVLLDDIQQDFIYGKVKKFKTLSQPS